MHRQNRHRPLSGEGRLRTPRMGGVATKRPRNLSPSPADPVLDTPGSGDKPGLPGRPDTPRPIPGDPAGLEHWLHQKQNPPKRIKARQPAKHERKRTRPAGDESKIPIFNSDLTAAYGLDSPRQSTGGDSTGPYHNQVMEVNMTLSSDPSLLKISLRSLYRHPKMKDSKPSGELVWLTCTT